MRRPRFIAEQARHARGPLGRLIAFIMARETLADNARAIEALALEPDDNILDVGCGHGASLSELARRAPQGRVTGADPSSLMVEIARARNRALVRAGRVAVVTTTADALPFPDASFDKALCVHVVYFWKDLVPGFRTIARVLKPGARLAVMFRSTEHEAAVRAFPADIYRFRSVAEISAALEEAGFQVLSVSSRSLNEPHLVIGERR